MKAYLKNYRQSPRKVRLVVDLIRGKNIAEAMALLTFTPKKATLQLEKLLKSAVTNAEHNFKVSSENLYISEITVDKGITMKRSMPRSRGMANPIHKHTSNVSVTLSSR